MALIPPLPCSRNPSITAALSLYPSPAFWDRSIARTLPPPLTTPLTISITASSGALVPASRKVFT